MSKKRTIIELKDVKKIYDLGEVKVEAVKGVSVSISENEFVAIVGPSGSGKSTMMNLVGALDVPTHGNILLHGKDIAHMSESNLAQIRGKTIGFIFQQFHLLPTLTAKGNVELPMIFQGKSPEERSRRAEKLLKQVGLGHRINHKPSELSGGERQRVAVARALANDPDVVLADEPTGNLDTKTGGQIMQLLLDLQQKEGKTIIMVTHDLELVKSSFRVIKIRDGLIEKIVEPKKKSQ